MYYQNERIILDTVAVKQNDVYLAAAMNSL